MITGPEMSDLNYFVLPRIQAHWKEVAYALRYDIHTVKAIEESSKENTKKCCMQLFEDWLTTNHGSSAGPKTWATLLTALGKIEELTAVREDILKDLKATMS